MSNEKHYYIIGLLTGLLLGIVTTALIFIFNQ